MTEFTGEDLTGSVFEDVYLTRARFHDVDLAGADFRLVNLTGVRIRDALLVDMDISGQISNLRVNGVDDRGHRRHRHLDGGELRPAAPPGAGGSPAAVAGSRPPTRISGRPEAAAAAEAAARA